MFGHAQLRHRLWGRGEPSGARATLVPGGADHMLVGDGTSDTLFDSPLARPSPKSPPPKAIHINLSIRPNDARLASRPSPHEKHTSQSHKHAQAASSCPSQPPPSEGVPTPLSLAPSRAPRILSTAQHPLPSLPTSPLLFSLNAARSPSPRDTLSPRSLFSRTCRARDATVCSLKRDAVETHRHRPTGGAGSTPLHRQVRARAAQSIRQPRGQAHPQAGTRTQ